jgi:twitching motility protein PilT
MVAGSLRGIICQRLIPGTDDNLTLAYEIMTNTSSISSLIGDGKTHQLKQTMQIGSKSGMCTLDQCLLDKYKLGLISYDTAMSLMTDQSIIVQAKQHFAMLEAQKLSQ